MAGMDSVLMSRSAARGLLRGLVMGRAGEAVLNEASCFAVLNCLPVKYQRLSDPRGDVV